MTGRRVNPGGAMLKVFALVVVVVAALVAAILLYAVFRWRAGTERLRARLEEGRSPITPVTYDPRELDSLPPPVQRYFRAVLRDGQPMITGVRILQAGTFNLSESGQRWVPFTADQRVVTRRPGFDWDARFTMMPGLTARAHDAYVGGEGLLHAALFAMFPIVVQHGTPEAAQGELMRFLAEAAWFPTALLPSQGVRWEPLDERSARATLQDDSTTVSLAFRFGEDGLIESVRSEKRPRVVAGHNIPTPWLARWSDWETHDGIRIPVRGEVSWLLPEGPLPYWRGRITRIEYELMR